MSNLSPDGRRALDQAETDLLRLIAIQRDDDDAARVAFVEEVHPDEYPDMLALAVEYIIRLAQPAAATSDLFGSLLDEMRLR